MSCISDDCHTTWHQFFVFVWSDGPKASHVCLAHGASEWLTPDGWWRQVVALRARGIPVVVSMGSAAASGG